MLHFEYLQPGSIIDLPELAGHIASGTTKFKVVAIHPGGMGVCFHLSTEEPKNDYALKCIRPDLLCGTDSLNRFHDELEVWLSASACDAVAEAIAVTTINDVPSMLAQWMSGGDLAHVLPKLSPERKLEAILRVTRGLHWVYEHLGVIHRDLKPANILIDSKGLVFVADWGLARPLNAAMRSIADDTKPQMIDRPDRTQAGSFLGTILYAAPEQILNAKAVDHRADIYSLGCIMFEMETGAPPFTGNTVQEIAYKHLHEPPPKLGGLFKKTSIGLDKIIVKCLLKDPAQRYQTYLDLEKAILHAAQQRKFSISECQVGQRYVRHQLGKGHDALIKEIENAPTKNNDFAVLEFDDMKPFLEEATNLFALGRFKEAEALLRHCYVPQILDSGPVWHFGHAIAETYAFCLQHLPDKLSEALEIYSAMTSLQQKPAEYYVNYSLALLRSQEWKQALAICKRGLSHYPEDLDILGNHTIALRYLDDLEGAQESALRRLSLRRDVHSLEEAVYVIRLERELALDADLPKAIKLAKMEYSLIREALSVNPLFPSLRITEIQFLRFAQDIEKVIKACQAVMEDAKIGLSYREIAFVEMVECMGSGKHFKTALEMIDKHWEEIRSTSARERIEFTKWNIFADQFMIGKQNKSGERIIIRQVMDYFCATKNGRYPYPVTSARVLEWIGRPEEAEELLRSELENSWLARKHLALFLQRSGRSSEAYQCAEYLIQMAPWRAETYDVLAYIAGRDNDSVTQAKAKRLGDRVFEKEMALYEDIRSILV